MGFKYKRSEKLENLLGILWDFSDSEHILFGHQNAGHIGVSISVTDGTESDCKNLCGSHPAIVGIDTLSFTGYEGTMNELITVVKNMRRQGLIITLSSHMPKFSLGGDEFYDYSPNITEGDCGRRILPGGDLNGKYRRFLDMIADFADRCVDVEGEKIPMIFVVIDNVIGLRAWEKGDAIYYKLNQIMRDGNYVGIKFVITAL